jgi:hypothetical protein
LRETAFLPLIALEFVAVALQRRVEYVRPRPEIAPAFAVPKRSGHNPVCVINHNRQRAGSNRLFNASQ